VGVIALSTVVMRFRAFSSESLPRTRCGVDTGSREENASNKEAGPPFRLNRNGGAGMRGPCFGIVNPDAAVRGKARRRQACFGSSRVPAIHQIKTTAPIALFAVRNR
jgi:hypothetical protein